MPRLAYLVLTVFFVSACTGHGRDPTHIAAASSVEAGHYAIMFAGCNDCHTPGWGASSRMPAESKWMTGSNVGFRGPWGTLYPKNVRLMVSQMPQDGWIALFTSGPPVPVMPFWNWSHGRADTRDLAAMYDYLKSLGPAGSPAPEDLSPGQRPRTKYVIYYPINP